MASSPTSFTHGDAQNLAGAQRQHRHDDNDGNGCAERRLFEANQQQGVREFTQLLVELGHGDSDRYRQEGVADPKEIQTEEEGDQG